MKAKIKRTLAILAALMMTVLTILPTYAAGIGNAILNTDYIKEETAVIGVPGYALTVKGDGSFYFGGETDPVAVLFGERALQAKIFYEDSYYPITTHKYRYSGFQCSLSQFIYQSEAGELYVYSRLKVVNTSDVSVAFPAVTGTVAITDVPDEIGAKKSATGDYVVKLTDKAGTSVDDRAAAISYDEAIEKVKSFWDTYLHEKLSVFGVDKKNGQAFDEYRKDLIYAAIGAQADPVSLVISSPDHAQTVLTGAEDLYASALALRQTEDYIVAATVLDELSALAEKCYLADGKLPYLTLEENLDALLSLQSYAYILGELEKTDGAYSEDAENAKGSAAALADAIAKAIKDTELRLSCDWETATTDRTYPVILNGDNLNSAAALCSWYTNSSVFAASPSKELVSLAKDAVDYYDVVRCPESGIFSLFSQREDGTVIIGRGCPVSLLAENSEISMSDIPLINGGTANLKITVDKKNVNISLSGALSAPVQIEFSAFRDNIEYASQGFDSESGIITIPEGVSSVAVRLEKSLSSVNKELKAAAELEKAISKAYAKASEIENPTSVSKDIFEKALKKAEKARTSTVDEKATTAEKLVTATEKLSPMKAEYVYSTRGDGVLAGKLTSSEIYQKFTLPADGTVRSLYIEGEYIDGISAAIYTLRGSAYTTDELCGESYGEQLGDGVFFEFDFEAQGGEVYVLCIFSESGEVTLSLEESEEYTAHTRSMGETIVYSGATLAFDISVLQADRSDLDVFYSACLEADVSKYTKESQKELKERLADAEYYLCTPSVTVEQNDKVYEKLQEAYDGLDTYASEDKIEDTPIIGIVLIGIVVVLLAATLISALAARKKMNSDN